MEQRRDCPQSRPALTLGKLLDFAARWIYQLSIEEQKYLDWIGYCRWENVIRDGLPNLELPQEANRLAWITLGVYGEYVAHRVTGLPWTAEFTLYGEGVDLGERTEVRTAGRSNGDLKVYQSSYQKDPTEPCVLVVKHRTNRYEVKGWISAGNGQKIPLQSRGAPGWKAAHFVPASQLQTIDTLPERGLTLLW